MRIGINHHNISLLVLTAKIRISVNNCDIYGNLSFFAIYAIFNDDRFHR